MYSKTFILFYLPVCLSCNNGNSIAANTVNVYADEYPSIRKAVNPYGSIKEITLPGGFKRIEKDRGSFAGWLLNVKLKKNKTVFTYDGSPKANQTAQFAVLDISIGNKDLQQCADAVMRLRAEYLFAVKKYRDIHFTDNAGTRYQFHDPNSSKNLHQYLQRVFGMCGSASLANQLRSISFNEVEPGDVIIRGGFPGHAVIVMDLAINAAGNKIYLLAQSYMPAQDIHVLVNPVNPILSPWYELNDGELIQTPEYTFTRRDLKRW